MTLTPLPKKYNTVSPIALPNKEVKETKSSTSNLLPILVIAGVGLFLMKS